MELTVLDTLWTFRLGLDCVMDPVTDTVLSRIMADPDMTRLARPSPKPALTRPTVSITVLTVLITVLTVSITVIVQ